MRIRSSRAIPAVTAAMAVALAAQLAAQAPGPSRRAHHAMAWDDASGRVILAGGSTPTDGGRNSIFFNDIWAFDGARWTQVGESGERMSGFAFAFDSRQRALVAFGGFNGQSLGVLRSLVGSDWRVQGQHPAVRAAEPGFVYDSKRDRFVAFGGSSGPGAANGETWEYDRSAWVRVPGAAPASRQAGSMVFDERRGRTVLFGGMGGAPAGARPPTLGDTWEYDGRAWVRREVQGPSPRASAGVTYDSKRGLVILFGGLTSDGFSGETWSWDGSEWKKLADSGPEPRAMGYLAYDARRDRVVLFGGRKGWPDGDLGDTWEWDGAVWRRVAG